MTTRPEVYARLARSAEPRVAAQYASDALAGDPERGTMGVAHSPIFVHTTAETNARRADARRRARILRDARDRMRARNYARGRLSESDGFVQRASVAADRQEAIGNGTTYVRRGRPRIPDLPRLTGMGL